MICCATHKVYCDACLIPRSVLKYYISTSSIELELLDCDLYIHREFQVTWEILLETSLISFILRSS